MSNKCIFGKFLRRIQNMCEKFCPKRTDMKIYKYYAPKDYNFDAFRRNQVFFSKPANFNDPFDTSALQIEPYKRFCKEIGWNSQLAQRVAEHGICCFTKSEKANNKHFWSHYADNYQGYVLEFDNEKISDVHRNTIFYGLCTAIYLQQVEYKDIPFDLDDFNLQFTFGEHDKKYTIGQCLPSADLDRLFQYLHLYKEKHLWGIENEWRMIIGENKPQKNMTVLSNGYLLDLPQGMIKSITIGYKMSHCDRCMLITCAKCKGIPIFEARPNIINNRWDVEINRIH